MNAVEWYFGFHKPYLSSYRGWFGHVEAWGYTADNTWFFIDPWLDRTRFFITHHHDDVIDMLAVRFNSCETVLKYRPDGSSLSFPIHPTMNCATTCGHFVGLRAFTPSGLRRKLLAHGAEVIHGQAQGRSRGQEGTAA